MRLKPGQHKGTSFALAFSFIASNVTVPAILVYVGLGILHSIPMAVVLYHGFCLVTIALTGVGVRNIRLPHVLELVGATIAGVLLSFVSVALWRLTGDLIADPDICSIQIEAFGLPVASWGMFAAYFMLVNPVIEELYWRGVVKERAKALGIRRDTIGAVPFSLWHIVPIWFVCGSSAAILGGTAVYVVGVLLTRIYRESRSFGRCITWHAMMADLAVVSLMFACR